MTSKVKGQGRKVTRSVWAVLAQCCTCVIRCRRGHAVSAEPGGHTSCFYLRQGRGCAITSVGLSCHSVWAYMYCKSNQLISLKLGVMIGPTNRKKSLTFGSDGDHVP